ncbi:GNAT family N-acetyltransferase [Streptomyces sp. SID5785]|uniref:GNAT family N-acetyltransferase n=1 Tax=Streptomyces sp. SID5785 TaxID=2690309 RepID=UPI0013619836|nr:GNAT family N-acetyltransferase [Streptomyces sp. SID5785]MZD07412.1 GNAT family N-acetyltransferase [Streptomyces sp. SID5785]
MTSAPVPGVRTRTARPEDYDAIVRVADAWWGRPVTALLNRLYLHHFCDTSLIAETESGELAGFVIGFLSPSRPDEAYIHFTGVAPGMRRTGLARSLYERFFRLARSDGRSVVRAVTSPDNARSIAFHEALGFTCSAPVTGYDGPGQDRVVLSRPL